MTILNATEARSRLYRLIDEAATTHQPIIITRKRGNAVLVSEEDWNSIVETLHLLSVPGMLESIKAGLNNHRLKPVGSSYGLKVRIRVG